MQMGKLHSPSGDMLMVLSHFDVYEVFVHIIVLFFFVLLEENVIWLVKWKK